MREFDHGKIPGSDVEHNMYIAYEPLPEHGPNWSGADEWLPKTDWSRDRIIANDD